MKSEDARDPDSTSTDEISIRTATEEDVNFIAIRGGAMFARAHEGAMLPEDVSAYLGEAFSAQRLRRHIDRADNVFLVASSEKKQVGYARLVDGPRSALVDSDAPIELRRLYVEDAWHGRGAAHALLDEAMLCALARGYRRCWLRVWEGNARAIAFYQKHGFVSVGSETSPYRSSNPITLVMERPL